MNPFRFLSRVLYGGTRTLEPLEAGLVEAACEVLDSRACEILREQVQQLRLVQRENENRMVLFFFDNERLPSLFADQRENLCLIEMDYRIGGRARKSKLFIHRGKLSSLESKIPISRADTQANPENVSVTILLDPTRGLGEDVDAEEHE